MANRTAGALETLVVQAGKELQRLGYGVAILKSYHATWYLRAEYVAQSGWDPCDTARGMNFLQRERPRRRCIGRMELSHTEEAMTELAHTEQWLARFGALG